MLKLLRKISFSDIEVVKGLQKRNQRVEEWFYNAAKAYFMSSFNKVFFDQDRKQEIFQDSFLRLWTQIENGKICIIDEKMHRQQKSGEYRPMTCTLQTFLMAIATNEYREIVRDTKEVTVPEFFDDAQPSEPESYTIPGEEDAEELKDRIVDDCLMRMSDRCKEILTMFYLEGKSLDDILEVRGDKNTSKGGLKTSKYKCITTLRERVREQFDKFNLTA